MEKPDQLGELFRMQQTLDERVGVETEGLSDEAKTRQFMGNHPQPTTMSRRRNQFETKTGGMTSSPIGRGKRKSRCSPVPARWRRELSGVLISRPQIAARVGQLARQIERHFAGGDLVIVALLNGTVLFLADLIRHLSLPLRLDFIGVSSYGGKTASGQLLFTKELRLDVRGRDVLLVDDILDTGKTLRRVLERLRQLKPRRVKICVLLEKKARRAETVQADYVGFSIPDLFVVGYGLDFAERYRNLPFVGVLRPEYYQIG